VQAVEASGSQGSVAAAAESFHITITSTPGGNYTMSKYDPKTSNSIEASLTSHIHNKTDIELYGLFCDSPYPLPDEAVKMLFGISSERLTDLKREYKKGFDEWVGSEIAKKDRAATA
jgi:hypothetical protein